MPTLAEFQARTADLAALLRDMSRYALDLCKDLADAATEIETAQANYTEFLIMNAPELIQAAIAKLKADADQDAADKAIIADLNAKLAEANTRVVPQADLDALAAAIGTPA